MILAEDGARKAMRVRQAIKKSKSGKKPLST